MSAPTLLAPLVSRRPQIKPRAGVPVWDHRPVVARPSRAWVMLGRLADAMSAGGLRVA